jgi:plasmid stabilization system protein ParE
VNEIALLRNAETDWAEILVRLTDIDPRLAEDFDDGLDQGLDQLKRMPHSAPKFSGAFHRLVLEEMPYGVFYAVEGSRIFVHAIFDLRQDPAVIRRRLGL